MNKARLYGGIFFSYAECGSVALNQSKPWPFFLKLIFESLVLSLQCKEKRIQATPASDREEETKEKGRKQIPSKIGNHTSPGCLPRRPQFGAEVKNFQMSEEKRHSGLLQREQS